MTSVLDAWAIAALLHGEPGAVQVADLVAAGDCVMSSINLGEVLSTLTRVVGSARAESAVSEVQREVRVESPDWPLVAQAARLKARGGISYADAFCLATAQRHGAPLYTGDPEIIGFDGPVTVIDLRPNPDDLAA